MEKRGDVLYQNTKMLICATLHIIFPLFQSSKRDSLHIGSRTFFVLVRILLSKQAGSVAGVSSLRSGGMSPVPCLSGTWNRTLTNPVSEDCIDVLFIGRYSCTSHIPFILLSLTYFMLVHKMGITIK